MTCEESGLCRSCIYRVQLSALSCNYLEVTGHVRGCPVEGCAAYIEDAAAARKTKRPRRTKERLEALRPRCEELRAEGGLTIQEIALRLHVDKQVVARFVREFEQAHPEQARKRKRPRPRLDRCAELHAEGMTDREIAAAMGLSRTTVRTYRERLGLEPNIK